METTDHTTKKPRQAIIVDETMLSPNGYIPAVITEGKPGYTPLAGNGDHAQPWYWGFDIAEAKKLAANANAELGLTPDDVIEIRLSSMRVASWTDNR